MGERQERPDRTVVRGSLVIVLTLTAVLALLFGLSLVEGWPLPGPGPRHSLAELNRVADKVNAGAQVYGSRCPWPDRHIANVDVWSGEVVVSAAPYNVLSALPPADRDLVRVTGEMSCDDFPS